MPEDRARSSSLWGRDGQGTLSLGRDVQAVTCDKGHSRQREGQEQRQGELGKLRRSFTRHRKRDLWDKKGWEGGQSRPADH